MQPTGELDDDVCERLNPQPTHRHLLPVDWSEHVRAPSPKLIDVEQPITAAAGSEASRCPAQEAPLEVEPGLAHAPLPTRVRPRPQKRVLQDPALRCGLAAVAAQTQNYDCGCAVCQSAFDRN